jgi:diguanylate cyclase (GGDEF)-like protein
MDQGPFRGQAPPLKDDKPDPESMLSSLSRQLSAIEKRDLELWMLVLVTSVIVSGGMLVILFPATFFKTETLHVELSMSKDLFFGLTVLIVLFNLYVISRRLEFRRTRQQLISSTIQNELIRLQSFTDPLTEVYNRRSLAEMANRYISHAQRLKTALTFLMLDVDRFKEVNTRFGHLTGDVVLAEVAAVLRNCVRGSDTVVRFGGDEFLVLLAETHAEGAQTVTRRIENAVSDWNQGGHLPGFEVNLSIGVAEWKEGKTMDAIIDEADRNMFANKKAMHS